MTVSRHKAYIRQLWFLSRLGLCILLCSTMYYCEKPAVVSPNNSANTAVFLPDRCPDPDAGLSQIVARAARLRHPSIGHYLINPTAGAAGDSDQ